MHNPDDKHPTSRDSNPVPLFRATNRPNKPSGPAIVGGIVGCFRQYIRHIREINIQTVILSLEWIFKTIRSLFKVM